MSVKQILSVARAKTQRLRFKANIARNKAQDVSDAVWELQQHLYRLAKEARADALAGLTLILAKEKDEELLRLRLKYYCQRIQAETGEQIETMIDESAQKVARQVLRYNKTKLLGR